MSTDGKSGPRAADAASRSDDTASSADGESDGGAGSSTSDAGSRAADPRPRAADADPRASDAGSSAHGISPSAQAPGMSTKSPGPVSPAVTLSDRAGEESFENQTASAPNDPLARVLRTLDSIDMPAGPVRTHEVGTVEQAPDGSQTDPAGGDPAPTDPAAPAPGRSDPAAPVRPGRPEGPGLPARRPSADEPAIPASPPEPLRTPAPAAQTRSEAILDGPRDCSPSAATTARACATSPARWGSRIRGCCTTSRRRMRC